MRKDKRKVLTLQELNSGINFCRWCIKKIPKGWYFCNDDCFGPYIESLVS